MILMKIVCDTCDHEFVPNELKMETLDGVDRYYLECPNCNANYTSYYLNDEMKEIQEEVQQLQNKPNRKQKQTQRLVKLKRKLVSMNAHLKEQMEG